MIILFIFDFWIVVVTQYDKVAFSWFGFLCPLSSALLVQGFRSARPLPLSFQSELPTFRNVNSQMKRARFCNKICLGVVNVDVVLVCVCINHIEQSHNLPIRNLASFEADEFYLVHLGFGVKNHLFFFFVIFIFFFLLLILTCLYSKDISEKFTKHNYWLCQYCCYLLPLHHWCNSGHSF